MNLFNYKNPRILAFSFIAIAALVGLTVVFISRENAKRDLEERVRSSERQTRSDAYTSVGFDLVKKENKPEDAERAFLRAIELDPKSQKQAYLGLAELYRFYMPEKDSEIPGILRSGLLYDPQDIILLRALAQYYERTKDIEQARHWYGTILHYYPQDVPAKQKIEELGP